MSIPSESTGELREQAEQFWSDLINEDDQGAIDKLAPLLAKLRAVERVEALAKVLTEVPGQGQIAAAMIYGALAGGAPPPLAEYERRALAGES